LRTVQLVLPLTGVSMQGVTVRSESGSAEASNQFLRNWPPAAQPMAPPASVIGSSPLNTRSATSRLVVRSVTVGSKNQSISAGLLATVWLNPGLVAPVRALAWTELENGLNHWHGPTPGVPVVGLQPGPPSPRRASWKRLTTVS
jgi:hypothetical protein